MQNKKQVEISIYIYIYLFLLIIVKHRRSHLRTYKRGGRKHDDRPLSENIEFDKCLWSGDIKPAANKLILARSTFTSCRSEQRDT